MTNRSDFTENQRFSLTNRGRLADRIDDQSNKVHCSDITERCAESVLNMKGDG